MQPISLNELITVTEGQSHGIADLNFRFARIAIDSRQVQTGDLFWALEGEHHDGHSFIQQALSNGAIAVVIDGDKAPDSNIPMIIVDDTLMAFWDLADWYRQQFDALVIGVTGSVGKTTTRRMISSVLSAAFVGIESPHNYNNEFGVPLSLFQLEAHHEFAVIELGAAQPGDIAELADIAHPEVGVITAIGPAHLDAFENFDNITKTKGELIESLPESGFAILNGDDKNVVKTADRAACQVIYIGEKAHNDLIATNVITENGWLGFSIQETHFEVPATGRHHLTSALIAIAIGRQVDMSDAQIAQGLRTYTAAPGRSEVLTVGPWTIIDDTYNANPVSMTAACRTLRDWKTAGKRILVTGDMLELGEWSEDFHRVFGSEVVQAKIDHLISVGSQATTVARSATKNGMDAGCLGACTDQTTAMLLLDLWLEPGAVVLVKGSRATHMDAIVNELKQLALHQESLDVSQRKAA